MFVILIFHQSTESVDRLKRLATIPPVNVSAFSECRSGLPIRLEILALCNVFG